MKTFTIDRDAAKDVGVMAALVLGVIEDMNGDGNEPTKKEVENAIGFLSAKQVRVSLKKLEDSGFITSSQPNISVGDVSKRYKVK